MDDQNVHFNGIPDSLMKEALEKAALRLAISPEMRDAYETKFGLKFYLLPPVVEPELIQVQPETADPQNDAPDAGLMIGNVWSPKWLCLLRETIHKSGTKIHWYGNSGTAWLDTYKSELVNDGILDFGFVSEAELKRVCKRYKYAIVPSGTLDLDDDRVSIAALSLPSRLPFLFSVCNIPVIVLGSQKTAAARFVKRFHLGVTCDYNATAFREAIEKVSTAGTRQSIWRTKAENADLFSAAEAGDWIWNSLALGRACDDKYEKLMPRSESDLVGFIEAPAPKDVFRNFQETYHCMQRLRNAGCAPDFVIDVGASCGVWSDTVKRVFPHARYILIDPLASKYRDMSTCYSDANPEFEWIEAAASNGTGQTSLQVSPDLYGSSLLRPADFRCYESVPVEITTIDNIASAKKLSGHGILKIDVQCAEHMVLAGAQKTLAQIDVLVLELSLVRYANEAKIFKEMLDLIYSLGFRYYDDAGVWRSPVNGTLLQKDIVSVRQDVFLFRVND
ncbi:MAG: FkbM family methyltransferase [Methylacidiphilales bacterium]|nr:FkbM family methyltransferase [Candidatus Methylacidiphilales bacterium]